MQWQNIMKDKWMNIGCEDDELKPYVEPPADVLDPLRIGKNPSHTLVLSCRVRGLMAIKISGEFERGRIGLGTVFVGHKVLRGPL